MDDFDGAWKEALDLFFEAFMEFFFRDAYVEIDWARGFEMLDKELQAVTPAAEVGRKVVDKLVKVWRKDGREEWVLIHIEVQNQEEADFGLRMYVYNHKLYDQYKRWVVSLAVLGDDRPGWRPDEFRFGLWGCSVHFKFPVVKLLKYRHDWAELETTTNPFGAVVQAHLKALETRGDDEARHHWKLRLVRGLYERGWTAERVRPLFRLIDWLMELPEDREEQFWQEIHQYEESKQMEHVTSVERRALRKGKEEGLREGLYEGIESNLARFGDQGLSLMTEIRQLTDLQQLRAVLRVAATATTLDEVRKAFT